MEVWHLVETVHIVVVTVAIDKGRKLTRLPFFRSMETKEKEKMMGYFIEMIDHDFFIAAKDKDAALNAMFDMWLPEKNARMSGGSWGQGRNETWYSWMNNSAEAFRNRTVESLEKALDEWGYEPETDDEGNIIGLYFEPNKIGDEDQMFAAIAPFVRPGSTLDFRGEEGAVWRWEFNGQTIVEKTGRVVFEER